MSSVSQVRGQAGSWYLEGGLWGGLVLGRMTRTCGRHSPEVQGWTLEGAVRAGSGCWGCPSCIYQCRAASVGPAVCRVGQRPDLEERPAGWGLRPHTAASLLCWPFQVLLLVLRWHSLRGPSMWRNLPLSPLLSFPPLFSPLPSSVLLCLPKLSWGVKKANQISVFVGSAQNGFLFSIFVFSDHRLGLSAAGHDVLGYPVHCRTFDKQSSCFTMLKNNRIRRSCNLTTGGQWKK